MLGSAAKQRFIVISPISPQVQGVSLKLGKLNPREENASMPSVYTPLQTQTLHTWNHRAVGHSGDPASSVPIVTGGVHV